MTTVRIQADPVPLALVPVLLHDGHLRREELPGHADVRHLVRPPVQRDGLPAVGVPRRLVLVVRGAGQGREHVRGRWRPHEKAKSCVLDFGLDVLDRWILRGMVHGV